MTHLSDPITIRNLTLPNRLVMPPMATAKADDNGYATDAVCEYYRERAKYSKIGLIITEHSYIHLQGKAHLGQTWRESKSLLSSAMRDRRHCLRPPGSLPLAPAQSITPSSGKNCLRR